MKKGIILMLGALLWTAAATAQTEGNATVGGEIYTIVEQRPEFPGGDDAMLQWLGSHVQYPTKAKEAGVEGTVFVTFVVERDGTVSNVKVVSPRNEMKALEEEAMRLVKAMPRWKPGKQRGKKVRVQFNLPIQFTL